MNRKGAMAVMCDSSFLPQKIANGEYKVVGHLIV